MLLPVEHVLLRESDALPAWSWSGCFGLTHFVWCGAWWAWIQVMDPGAAGADEQARSPARFVRTRDASPAADFAAWTREPGFLDPLRLRLHRLGVRDAGQRIAAAAAGADWRPCVRWSLRPGNEQLLSAKSYLVPCRAGLRCLWQEVVRDVESRSCLKLCGPRA